MDFPLVETMGYKIVGTVDDQTVKYNVFKSNKLYANIAFRTYVGVYLHFIIRINGESIINLDDQVYREHQIQEKHDDGFISPYCHINDLLLKDFKDWKTKPISEMPHVMEFLNNPLGMVERIAEELYEESLVDSD